MKQLLFALIGSCLGFAAGASVVGPGSTAGAVNSVQPATVMEVNAAGTGHVNLVPYYTVRSGFDTYLNIVNTDTLRGKAVKVRFRSAVNGNDVYSFTVLLGPGDAWAAAVTRDGATNYARLVTNDRSCTLPANVVGNFPPTYPVFGERLRSDEDPTRTHEGSVEIITMADLAPTLADGSPSPLFAQVQSGGAGAQPGCATSVLGTLGSGSTNYVDARSKGLDVPTSGLVTQWTLINVPRAVSYTAKAVAVEARAAANGPPGYGNVVLFPQTNALVMEAERRRAYTTVPNYSTDPIAPRPATEKSFPDLSTPYLPAILADASTTGREPRLQAYATSKALAATSINEEFVLEPSILAKTDWVLTLPTRYLQVVYDPPSGTTLFGPGAISLTIDVTGAPIAGTSNFFSSDDISTGLALDPICLGRVAPFSQEAPTGAQPPAETTWRSREGVSLSVQPEASVGGTPLLPFALCGHSSVLRFAKAGDAPGTGAVGDARNRRQVIVSGADSGWGRIRLPGAGGIGLPIIGFAAMELFNSAVTPGIAGVYGLTFPLGTTKPYP